MLLRNTLIFLISSLLLALLMAGCSDSTTKTETTGDTNLTDGFGGYKPTAESPAFGDNELMNMPGGMEAEDPTGFTRGDVRKGRLVPQVGLRHGKCEFIRTLHIVQENSSLLNHSDSIKKDESKLCE